MASRLSAERVREYRDQGFLIVDEPLFATEKFAAFKERFEMHLQVWEEVVGSPAETIDRAHFVDPVLNDWLLADEVLDLVEPLIGPDIALFASSCLNKLSTVGKRVPWHEDGSYWKSLASNRIEVATVWLAIDASTTAACGSFPDRTCSVIASTSASTTSATSCSRTRSKRICSTNRRPSTAFSSRITAASTMPT
jgi:hypothetical protein